MNASSRLNLGALAGDLEEVGLLARLADAVLDYVADAHHARDPAGACNRQVAKPACAHQARAGKGGARTRRLRAWRSSSCGLPSVALGHATLSMEGTEAQSNCR